MDSWQEAEDSSAPRAPLSKMAIVLIVLLLIGIGAFMIHMFRLDTDKPLPCEATTSQVAPEQPC